MVVCSYVWEFKAYVCTRKEFISIPSVMLLGNSFVLVQCEGVKVIEFVCLKAVRLPRL